MKSTKIFGISAVAACAWLAPIGAAQAAFGDTDTTFGTSTAVPGFTITDLGAPADFGQDVVTGIGDRLYVLGVQREAADSPTVILFVTRYSKDGVIDPDFGTDGRVQLGDLPVPAPGSLYHFDVLDADNPDNGRIYVSAPECSASGCTLNVARLLFDGTPDESFATHGLAKFPISADAPLVTQVMVLNDGKVLVLYQRDVVEGDAVTGTSTVVARVTLAGQLDATFGTNGRADVSVGTCDLKGAPFMTIGRPADHVYVTTGARNDCDDPPTPAVSRVESDGTLDPGFGTGGRVVGAFGTGDIVGLAAQDQLDGGIAYAMARFAAGNVLNVDIIGLDDDGTRDTSVSTVSGTYNPVEGFLNVGGSLFQSDGRLVLNGLYETAADDTDQAITRIEGSARFAHAARFETDVEPVLPFVGFSTASATVNEGAGTATITVILSRKTSQDVTVPFTLGGSATRTIDYNVQADRFVIPAGQLTASITVALIDDSAEEAGEAILVTLGAPQNARSNPPAGPLFNAFILNITDDDLQVTPAPESGDGGGSLDWLLLSGLLGLAGLRRKSLRPR